MPHKEEPKVECCLFCQRNDANIWSCPILFFLHLLLPFSLVQYLISDQETCALFKSSGITVSVRLNCLFCLETGEKLVIQHSLPLPCIMWNEGRHCSVRQVRAVSCFTQMWVGPSSPLWAGGCSQINAAPLRGRIQIKITVNVGWSICLKPYARRMRNANSHSHFIMILFSLEFFSLSVCSCVWWELRNCGVVQKNPNWVNIYVCCLSNCQHLFHFEHEFMWIYIASTLITLSLVLS